jgi:23S rRNA (uracil1939-C5)-methyltransferase
MIIEITALAAGGDGVGRDEGGRVTFVPRTAVGDRVEVRLVEEKKKFARGEVVRVVEPSRDRVSPPCPHFIEGCGGCQWQHITREAQLAAKQAIVEGALRKVDVKIEPIADPAPPYGWRRRARFHVEGGVQGLYVLDSNRLLAIDRCPQLEPALDDARRGLTPMQLPVDGELHIARSKAGKVAVGDQELEIEPGLVIRARDFAQASTAGNAKLVELVRAAVGTGTGKLLELYAGAGNFTRFFVEDGWDVMATDIFEPLKPPPRFQIGPASKVLERVKGPVEVIVLDPPRTGAAEAVPGIIKQRPSKIVYISCDPSTLARDAEALVAAGYRVERASPVDLMPQTSHVEVVMTFSLSQPA